MHVIHGFMNVLFKKHLVRTLVMTSLAVAVPFASAQCMQSGQLQGLNIAGAEFNSSRVPGQMNKDYLYPRIADLDYVKAIGGNAIRLPFRWERVQPTLNGDLDAVELKAITDTVNRSAERGLCVILDVHNYATYRAKTIGSSDVPTAAFIDLWKRLATAFPDPDKTIFGLMNEPAKISIAQWAPIAQQTVLDLRAAGAKNIILVAGGRWSGAHEWLKDQGGTSNAIAFAALRDPLERTWLEAHQYADPNYSGTGTECVDADRFARIFGPLTAWAEQNKQKLFLGEFGTPGSEKCLAALDAMLSQLSNANVWRGWTYWAAGAWWGNYPMSVQPKNGVDTPQTAVLKKYFR